MIGLIVGALTLCVASDWQWARLRLVNSRFWRLAIDPGVPDGKVWVTLAKAP